MALTERSEHEAGASFRFLAASGLSCSGCVLTLLRSKAERCLGKERPLSLILLFGGQIGRKCFARSLCLPRVDFGLIVDRPFA